MFFKQNQLYMILQKQFSPQDWATSWWSEASLHQTWSKLFSPTFQCFLCGFPAGRIYIYICLHFFLTIFTLFFWPTWQNCSKLGAEKLSTLNVAAFPGQGSLFSEKKIFLKRKQIKPTACVSNQVKEKEKISARGVFEKTSRRWRTDHALGSRCWCGMFSWEKYFITLVRDKDLVSPLCMSMFVSSPTFSFSSSSIAIRIVSISLDSFRLQEQDCEVAKY